MDSINSSGPPRSVGHTEHDALEIRAAPRTSLEDGDRGPLEALATHGAGVDPEATQRERVVTSATAAEGHYPERFIPVAGHTARAKFTGQWTNPISAGPTLLEQPSDTEGSDLSQIAPFSPANDADSHPLPPRPPSVCAACWKGPFAAHFGLPLLSSRDGKLYRDWPEEVSYWTSVAEMTSRARAGCVWCGVVPTVRMLRRASSKQRVLMKITVRGMVSQCGAEALPHAALLQRVIVEADDTEILDGFVFASPDNPAAPYITARSPILHVGSHHAMASARAEIDRCVNGHERCKQVTVCNPRLPTRLVDCADPDHPRLAPSEEGGRGEYLALSYVWGGAQPHRTTTANFAAHTAGIDASVLPQTIRDAIHVTRGLGFRYLWVDSLCIVQDSDGDKRHEIGRMHDIYRYAHLTLVAGGVEKASDSFLYERPAPQGERLGFYRADLVSLPFVLPPARPGPPNPTSSPGGDRDTRATSAREVGEVYLASFQLANRLPVRDLGRISTRAWCMQEYLLSPRSLIFTTRTVQYKCCTTQQAIGNAYPKTVLQDIPYALFLPDAPAAEPGSGEWTDVHRAWQAVVEDYSGRMASVEADKLVACAAVAEQFHGALRCEYLAGVWRSAALLGDLLWEMNSRPVQPAAYRAPSWSWAAIDGRVRWRRSVTVSDFGRGPALAEVVKCEVTLKDAALPFGEVMGGTLVLRGTLLPLHREDSGARFVLPSLEQARRLRWGLGPDTDSEYSDGTKAGPIEHGPFRYRHWSGFDRADGERDGVGQFWAVPFVRTESDDVRGLLLALADRADARSGRAPVFRRIGCFTERVDALEDKAEIDALWDPLSRAAGDGEFPLEMTIV